MQALPPPSLPHLASFLPSFLPSPRTSIASSYPLHNACIGLGVPLIPRYEYMHIGSISSFMMFSTGSTIHHPFIRQKQRKLSERGWGWIAACSYWSKGQTRGGWLDSLAGCDLSFFLSLRARHAGVTDLCLRC